MTKQPILSTIQLIKKLKDMSTNDRMVYFYEHNQQTNDQIAISNGQNGVRKQVQSTDKKRKQELISGEANHGEQQQQQRKKRKQEQTEDEEDETTQDMTEEQQSEDEDEEFSPSDDSRQCFDNYSSNNYRECDDTADPSEFNNCLNGNSPQNNQEIIEISSDSEEDQESIDDSNYSSEEMDNNEYLRQFYRDNWKDSHSKFVEKYGGRNVDPSVFCRWLNGTIRNSKTSRFVVRYEKELKIIDLTLDDDEDETSQTSSIATTTFQEEFYSQEQEEEDFSMMEQEAHENKNQKPSTESNCEIEPQPILMRPPPLLPNHLPYKPSYCSKCKIPNCQHLVN